MNKMFCNGRMENFNKDKWLRYKIKQAKEMFLIKEEVQ